MTSMAEVQDTPDLWKERGEPGAGVAFLKRQRIIANAITEDIRLREEFGPIGNGKCGLCNTPTPYLQLFRCFYCLNYLCEECAEKHFGQTRREYWKEKEAVKP